MDDWLCVKRNFVDSLGNSDFLADGHSINLRVSQMGLISIALLMRKGGGLSNAQKLLDYL